jgi:hypothetical protein
MVGTQKVGDAVEGVIIHQNGAKQRLFRFDVMRRAAVAGRRLGGRDLKRPAFRQLLDWRHGSLGLFAETDAFERDTIERRK